MTSISSADFTIRWRIAAFDTSTSAAPGKAAADHPDVVVPVPVGVDDVVTEGPAPGHARVDVGRDGEVVVLGDHIGVRPAEGRVEEVRVVLHVVVRGEQGHLDAVVGHDLPQRREPALHLLGREGQLLLFPVADQLQAFEFGDGHGVLLIIVGRAVDVVGASGLTERVP
jgi:hypothetical protein